MTESRNGEILLSIINGTEYTAEPQSRIEELLLELKKVIENGGSSGGTAVKKLTYTGNGASINTITFPEQPTLILCISGPGNSGTYCSSQPSIWGAPHVFTRYAYANGQTGMIQAPATYSGNSMTLTQTDLGASFNINGGEYVVFYV